MFSIIIDTFWRCGMQFVASDSEVEMKIYVLISNIFVTVPLDR